MAIDWSVQFPIQTIQGLRGMGYRLGMDSSLRAAAWTPYEDMAILQSNVWRIWDYESRVALDACFLGENAKTKSSSAKVI